MDSHAWDDVEDKLDQAITEVMLTDRWRDAPTLVILRDVLERGPLPVQVEAKKLLQLLDTPVRELNELQVLDLSSELVSVLRFVCHRGRDE